MRTALFLSPCVLLMVVVVVVAAMSVSQIVCVEVGGVSSERHHVRVCACV
jgi:hypothetical protein